MVRRRERRGSRGQEAARTAGAVGQMKGEGWAPHPALSGGPDGTIGVALPPLLPSLSDCGPKALSLSSPPPHLSS